MPSEYSRLSHRTRHVILYRDKSRSGATRAGGVAELRLAFAIGPLVGM